MSNKHSPRYGVIALGFSDHEKAVMESFFRIAGQRSPGWWLTDNANEASAALVNATSRNDVDACIPKMTTGQPAIIIGNSDFGTGWLNLPRPIRLMVTLTKLGELVSQELDTVPPQSDTVPAGLAPVAASSASAPAAAPRPAIPPSVPALAVIAAQPSRPASVISEFRVATPAGQALQKPASPASEPGKVLVVDDSDVALKFMQSRLRGFGYHGQLARSGEEALAMVASYDFKFVFLDVMMAGMDGYQTCRAIKQYKSRNGKPPVVIMLTSRGGTIDKIRGSMAGCDGYLTKPLNERLLAAMLAKHDPAKAA
jgi:two-component system, cell cycle response regulator